MEFDPSLTFVALSISLIGISSAAAGWIAHVKRRPPMEGVLLGLFLGPIGVLIESRTAFVHRPMVDRDAFNSFKTLTVYQDSSEEVARKKDRSN